MTDYTEDQLKEAARRAYADGNIASAQRLIAEAQRVGASSAADTGGRTFGQTLYENIIGSGEVDTPGERLGQTINETGKAFFSGVARGGAELVGLPGTAMNLLDRGYEAAGLIPEGSAERLQSPISGEALRGYMSDATGGATEYRSDQFVPRIAGTIGEFAGGGAGGRVAAVGGTASELAGMATEDTVLEPYARVGAGIAGSILAGGPRPAFRGDDAKAGMANTLDDMGVRNVTAGQASGNRTLMAMEGRLEPTAAQLDDFTASIMRRLGSEADTATPTALSAVQSRIVGQMDDAVANLDIVPNATFANRSAQITADYIERVPQGQLTPRIGGIAQEIRQLYTSGTPVPLSRLRQWRSDIGNFSVSNDASTREAAHALRGLIDDMTDTALQAAGRTDDIARLADARTAYREFIAVRDAASRAGAEAGTLSPTQLNQSIIRSQGREAYATGNTTTMADMTRAGASILRPASTVRAGATRSLSETLPIASALASGGLGFQAGLGPEAIAALAAAGTMAPAAGRAIMRSAPVQGLLRDPSAIISRPASTAGGLLASQ